MRSGAQLPGQGRDLRGRISIMRNWLMCLSTLSSKKSGARSSASADGRLQERFPHILPMSGAQLIQVDETLSRGSEGDVRERRRIEIRLRKYERAGPDTVTQRGHAQ